MSKTERTKRSRTASGDGETKAGEKLELLAGADSEDEATLKVSEKFAKKFGERKDREVLAKSRQILEDEDDTDTDSEDDEAALLTPCVENKIFETLSKIKRRDPSIYDSKQKIFNDEDFEEPEASADDSKKLKKGLTYKKFLRDTLMTEGAEAFAKAEEAEEIIKKKSLKTPIEEQRELQAEMRRAAQAFGDEDGDEDGDLFSLKQQSAEDMDQADDDFEKFMKTRPTDIDSEKVISDKYWKPDEDLDPNERFLRDYILNRGWDEATSIQKQSGQNDASGEANDSQSEEEHLEEADRFEAEYNFRFEMEEGSEIQGHQRFPQNSVREREDKRKRQRQQKKERLEEDKVRRTEELKRLKNLKKQEIARRLEQIKAISGKDGVALEAEDLEADFNPDEHDKQIGKVLGDDFDDEEEALDPDDLTEAPKGVDDLTTDALTKFFGASGSARKRSGSDASDKSLDNFLSGTNEVIEEPAGKDDAVGGEDDGNTEGLWFMCDGCQKPIPGGKKHFDCSVCENYTLCIACFRGRRHPHKFVKRKVPLNCAPPQDLDLIDGGNDDAVDELAQLDFEDVIGGDLPTRFHYRKVEANSFGLSAKDILEKPDNELNAMVSIKKLRPYRESRSGGLGSNNLEEEEDVPQWRQRQLRKSGDTSKRKWRGPQGDEQPESAQTKRQRHHDSRLVKQHQQSSGLSKERLDAYGIGGGAPSGSSAKKRGGKNKKKGAAETS